MFTLRLKNAPEITKTWIIRFGEEYTDGYTKWSGNRKADEHFDYHIDLSKGEASNLRIALLDEKNWYIVPGGSPQFAEYYYHVPLLENGDFVFDFSNKKIYPRYATGQDIKLSPVTDESQPAVETDGNGESIDAGKVGIGIGAAAILIVVLILALSGRRK
jgi:hypothetical protein